MWKIKKKDFFAKIAWHDLCQEGRKTRIFVHTICSGQFFWPKQIEPRNTIKIGVPAEFAQNQKWHLFWEKVFFWYGRKNWVLLTVFLRSCVFCFFGGFKGQVTVAQRATSLGPKPSLFSFFCFVFVFLFFFVLLSFLLIEKPVFPLKRAFLLLICLCFPLFLFSFFGSPLVSLYLFLSVCLSLSLSLSMSLSCSFLSSFLSVFHFCFWFLLFFLFCLLFCFKKLFCFSLMLVVLFCFES